MPATTRRPGAARPSLVRDTQGRYVVQGPLTDDSILSAAEAILLEKCQRLGVMSNPSAVLDFLRSRLGALDHERFECLWLDSQHRLIAIETLATGTLDGATVYPREAVKAALRHNAAAVLFAHNHPSGHPEPSAADRAVTERLKAALAVIDIRVLDHLVVSAEGGVSFSMRGWL
jgi:DNA repair protein RadC